MASYAILLASKIILFRCNGNERNGKAGLMLPIGYDISVLLQMFNVTDLEYKSLIIDTENQ